MTMQKLWKGALEEVFQLWEHGTSKGGLLKGEGQASS